MQLSITEKSLKFSPSVLEFIKIALKITRVARVLRLLKVKNDIAVNNDY